MNEFYKQDPDDNFMAFDLCLILQYQLTQHLGGASVTQLSSENFCCKIAVLSNQRKYSYFIGRSGSLWTSETDSSQETNTLAE